MDKVVIVRLKQFMPENATWMKSEQCFSDNTDLGLMREVTVHREIWMCPDTNDCSLWLKILLEQSKLQYQIWQFLTLTLFWKTNIPITPLNSAI